MYTFNATALPGCTNNGNTGTTTSAAPTTSPAVSTTSTSPTTTSPTTTSNTITASPTSTLPVHNDGDDSSEWYVLGCAVDSANRLLTGASKTNDQSLTVDGCLTWCEDQGFAFAGVEFGEECYCGHTVPTTITYNDASCDKPCTGDNSETCGGGWGLELFELVKGSSSCPTTSSSSFQMGG